jgi:hypothetical protein
VGPVALLRTHRRAWKSRDDDGVLIAELVVDEVSARPVGPGEEEHIWQEVEVELGPAAPAGLLDQVEDRLGAVGLRRSGSKSKLARLLADRLPDRGGGGAAVASSGSAGAAVLAYLQTHALALRRCVVASLRSGGAARPCGRGASDAGGRAAPAQRVAGLRSGARPRPHRWADR